MQKISLIVYSEPSKGKTLRLNIDEIFTANLDFNNRFYCFATSNFDKPPHDADTHHWNRFCSGGLHRYSPFPLLRISPIYTISGRLDFSLIHFVSELYFILGIAVVWVCLYLYLDDPSGFVGDQ
jgi:hypothetical protein